VQPLTARKLTTQTPLLVTSLCKKTLTTSANTLPSSTARRASTRLRASCHQAAPATTQQGLLPHSPLSTTREHRCFKPLFRSSPSRALSPATRSHPNEPPVACLGSFIGHTNVEERKLDLDQKRKSDPCLHPKESWKLRA